MKIFNIFFIILFVVSAVLQYNDPDPYLWVPIYLFAAWLCYLAVQKKYPAVLYFIGLAFYSGYAVLLLFDKNGVLNWLTEHNAENIAQSMKATRPWIEVAREFFGLLIIIAVLVVNLIWMKKQKNAGGKTEVKRNG
jgi:hypothetical protein